MEKIDGVVREVTQRLIEPAAQERREALESFVELSQVSENFFAIDAGVLIAPPGVDGVAAGSQLAGLHRRAERGVGYAGMCSELDQKPRLGGGDDPMGERHMLPPGAFLADAKRGPEQRVQRRVGDVEKRPVAIVLGTFLGQFRHQGDSLTNLLGA